ncbi:hypothetical protein FJT64_021470 [Amphibalanus amphitrite]|uniref:Uncharacterized protein n=1 Tax=Amphibalanus amphitrite TaxID=1232801 RepID=A0A6A4WI65_AMPAM|nr:hypothetical protein FJT64_021470 [Amphibalanus amphitrite]
MRSAGRPVRLHGTPLNKLSVDVKIADISVQICSSQRVHQGAKIQGDLFGFFHFLSVPIYSSIIHRLRASPSSCLLLI